MYTQICISVERAEQHGTRAILKTGHQQEIQAERDRKLDAAKEQRKNRRQGGGVMDENGLLPLADNAELTQRQGQAYSQRSESPRFREESLHLGMRAAVDQVL